MFTVGGMAMTGSLVLQLDTFCDAWMTHNLRGREQPEIFKLNYPRLASTLKDISAFMDAETEPGDPTEFGVPTRTGVSARGK